MGIDNPIHIIFIAAVALIVLGPKRLPELARSLGSGMREFRDSLSQAANGDGHVAAPLVPQQAQLVAAPEPLLATATEALVVDPAAPDLTVSGPPATAGPVASAGPAASAAAATAAPVDPGAAHAVGQPAPPPVASPPPPAS